MVIRDKVGSWTSFMCLLCYGKGSQFWEGRTSADLLLLLGPYVWLPLQVESGESLHPSSGSATVTGHAICPPTFQSLINATLKPDVSLDCGVASGGSDGDAAAAPPQQQQMTREDIILTKMAADTREVMATPDFASLLNLCLKIAFMRVGEQLGEHFSSSAASSSSSSSIQQQQPVENGKIVPRPPPKLPLAKVVPWMSGLVNSICSSPPNMFMHELLLLEPLTQFSCNVYDAFSQEGKFWGDLGTYCFSTVSATGDKLGRLTLGIFLLADVPWASWNTLNSFGPPLSILLLIRFLSLCLCFSYSVFFFLSTVPSEQTRQKLED